jgi:hypothetical protein
MSSLESIDPRACPVNKLLLSSKRIAKNMNRSLIHSRNIFRQRFEKEKHLIKQQEQTLPGYKLIQRKKLRRARGLLGNASVKIEEQLPLSVFEEVLTEETISDVSNEIFNSEAEQSVSIIESHFDGKQRAKFDEQFSFDKINPVIYIDDTITETT